MCHVGEKTLRTWWEANEGQAAPAVAHDITAVDVNPDLPAAIQAKVRALLRRHEGVFEGRQVTMPKPFQAEPVELKFVDNPIPQSVPEPRWTFAQKNVLTQWAEAGLKDGSLELSTSRWASRPHIVMKTPAHKHKDLVDVSQCKLRVCGDYRAVNSQIAKIVPNLPTGLEEVEKAAGHLWYWESDSVACYSQFTLAAGRSREALAVWTPLGLVQPTTLPFGQKNSGTEAQGPYRAAASEMNRGRHGNYVDDWIGYSDELDQLIEDFECFLKVCEKYVITLGTAKTRFGYSEAQFFGFRVNKEGSHLALKHLDPIRNLVPPGDIHELRRVLGLFVVSRKYLADYALLSRPMTEILKGKPPTFRWGPEQQAAFDTIRDKLLEGVHLAAPDFSLPFHLATDASEDGKGGELYQLPSIPIAQQYPYDVKIHAPDNHAVIFFLSKAFDETQRLRPPFYLEGDSLLWCTLKCKFYALSSPFPLYTYSDHMPLKWMEKTEKGPISSFILEHLSEMETVHQYIQGKVNTLPDACSRYPMLGPKRLATRGLANSVSEMLRRLPCRIKAVKLAHFHGGKQSAELRESLKDWFYHVSALQPATPPTKTAPVQADFAVMIPRCEVAPVALARYLLSTIPFALLIPVDLLAESYAPELYKMSPHEEIEARFAKAGKITILATQMTWVIGNLEDCHPIEIFSSTLRTPAPVTGFGERRLPDGGVERAILDDDALDEVEGTVPRTLEAWVRAQKLDAGFDEMVRTMEDCALRNELWIQALPGRTPTIVVPSSCQELLVRDTHARLHHVNHAKVHETLKRSYCFPAMKTQTRKWLEDCPECELNKARQQTAHALFHSAPVHAPRAKWCMDFQGQGTAATGETEVLALIDPTSRYVVVIPLKDRQASTWLQPFLDRIVFTFGAPDVLHSDDAPEFISEALDLLAKAADIKTTTTLGHNARGNATIEVWWRFWNRCLRLLSDEHYLRWPEFASRIAFAYNATPHEGIGAVTAFQIYHGTDPRNTLASSLADPPVFTEDEELALPAQFADAVAMSTQAFTKMAKTHDEVVKSETALRLNKKGSSKSFEVGQKVKVRVPPTQNQLLETGRRAKHITAWRGPCTILERLSTTAYAAVDDTTKRRYERVVSNILPYKASRAKTNADASFSEVYSAPFVVGEFIAVRDEPTGPFYVALVQHLTKDVVRVHYHGTTSIVLANAVFKPCWNHTDGDEIILSQDAPSANITQQRQFVPYTGEIDLKDVYTVLVARNLEFTKAGRLRFRALRSLAPVHDQLFRFTL
jgi:transposase InsO family protein